ncbi:MAG: hypothetical protein ACRENO_10535 [Thermodesulfobacteriota bacterium]
MYSKINSEYPFIKISILLGIIIGAVMAFLLSSALLGFSVFAVFICAGFLWNQYEPPVFPFCFAYQFAFIVSGYIFFLSYEYYPRLVFIGDIEKAVLFSVIGLIFVFIGIRTALSFFNKTILKKRKLNIQNVQYFIPVLFWVVIITNLVNLFVSINPNAVSITGSQYIQYALSFRNVFVFLLFLEILKQRKGYKYGLLAFFFILIPTFASFFSDFKYIFFIIAIIVASEIKPAKFSRFAKNRNRIIILSFLALLVSLFIFALYWEGGVKEKWRGSLKEGSVQGTPLRKAEQFGEHLKTAHENFNFESNLESLSARLSSGLGYFSYVVQRVPKLVPHEDGALTKRALEHVFKPRILFPNKPSLGGDSWLVRKYAGLWVAGEELNTSIALGYIPEFYIDYGIYGIIFLSLFYGLIVGLLYKSFILVSPSYNLYFSTSSIFLLNCFSTFEGEIAKLLGGMVVNFIIFFILLKYFGRFFHQKIMPKKRFSQFPVTKTHSFQELN